MGAASLRPGSGLWTDAARADSGLRARPFSALGLAWPATGLPRNHHPPAHPFRTRPALRPPPPPWFFLFLPLADRPASPRPSPPGRAGSAALRFRLAAGRKPKGGAGEGRAAMHIHQGARSGGGGNRPEWVWQLARRGRPSRVAGLVFVLPGWGPSARGRVRREAPPVCGVAGSARLCAAAVEGPPGGRGERGAGRNSRARLCKRTTVTTKLV